MSVRSKFRGGRAPVPQDRYPISTPQSINLNHRSAPPGDDMLSEDAVSALMLQYGPNAGKSVHEQQETALRPHINKQRKAGGHYFG